MQQFVTDEQFWEHLSQVGVNEFTNTLKAAGIGLILVDLETNHIEMNASLLSLLGRDRGVVLDRETARAKYVHPDDIEITHDMLRDHFDNDVPYETVMRLQHADGHYLYCATHARVVRGADGTPVNIIGIVRNVDSLVRSKESMQRAERMARLGNFHHDLVSNVITWSDGLYHIHGYAPGSFEPKLDWIRSRYVGEDGKHIAAKVDHAIATGESVDARARIVTRDDEIRYIKALAEVEIGPDGTAAAYYGTVQDITDEVRREELLLQSQKVDSLGNLAGGMAHDFNNHLAVILGNLELLREEIDNPDLQPMIDAGISAALSGAELTRNMLSFARRAPLEPKIIDLNKVVRQLDEWARRTLPANIETEVSLQAGLWKTEADRSLAESALLNLVLNARDAMPDGGKLTIETSNVRVDEDYVQDRQEDLEAGRYVMLSVSDTGHGIAPDIVDRVLDPFFTTKEPGKGSGLGLSMVQGFLKQSGGTLRIYSEQNVGTTFNALFPAKQVEPKLAKPQRPVQNRPGGSGVRVLVAEDDPNVGATLSANLEAAGFDVTVANSGDAAKLVFEEDPTFDILLTDIVMPGHLQGTSLARELRKIRGDLPVVFMSGYANEAKVHGNGLRPEDVRLMKPVRRNDLVDGIERALRRAK